MATSSKTIWYYACINCPSCEKRIAIKEVNPTSFGKGDVEEIQGRFHQHCNGNTKVPDHIKPTWSEALQFELELYDSDGGTWVPGAKMLVKREASPSPGHTRSRSPLNRRRLVNWDDDTSVLLREAYDGLKMAEGKIWKAKRALRQLAQKSGMKDPFYDWHDEEQPRRR